MSDTFDKVDFAARITLFLGMLLFGVALGAAIGLSQLQSSCMASGILPRPGTACWDGATSLQTIANTAGWGGAALLLSGAALDEFDDRAREVLGV